MTQPDENAWRIEKARPEDWARICEICCETSPGAKRMTPRWREFFGEFWVGPYRRLVPQWTWVARRAPDGPLLGYLTGAPGTASFERRRTWQHRLPLLVDLLRGRYPWNPDARRWLRRSLRLDVHPERCFGAAVKRELRARYPAHLHTNLAPEAQGQGAGKRLIEAYASALEAYGAAGIHLFCGPGPVGFYEKAGFRILARAVLPGSGAQVLVLVRALRPSGS